MSFVPIEKLTEVVENKYEAVLVAAKEARVQNSMAQLSDLDPNEQHPKVTSVALGNLIEGRVRYFYGEDDAPQPEQDEEVLDLDEEADAADDD